MSTSGKKTRFFLHWIATQKSEQPRKRPLMGGSRSSTLLKKTNDILLALTQAKEQVEIIARLLFGATERLLLLAAEMTLVLIYRLFTWTPLADGIMTLRLMLSEPGVV